MLKEIYIFYSLLSTQKSSLSLPSLLRFSISALSSLRTQTPPLLSLPSLLGPVFRLWLGCGLIGGLIGGGLMIFFEWVCSGGFRIGWVSNRRCGFRSVVGVVAVVGFGLMVCVWVTVGSLYFFFFFFLAMTGA